MELNQESVLLIVGIIVLLMGIAGAVPGIELGTEPIWHSALKIVIGLAAIIVAISYKDMAKTTLMVVGVLVLLMGIAGAVPGIELGTEPIWHSALKIIIGLVAIIFAYTKKE